MQKNYLFHKSPASWTPPRQTILGKGQNFQRSLPKNNLSLFLCGNEPAHFVYPGVPSWTTANFKQARERQDTDISTDFRESGACRKSWERARVRKHWNVGFELSHSSCCLCPSIGVDLQKNRLHYYFSLHSCSPFLKFFKYTLGHAYHDTQPKLELNYPAM